MVLFQNDTIERCCPIPISRINASELKLESSLSVNGITGDLIWDSPTQLGEYNVAILIEE